MHADPQVDQLLSGVFWDAVSWLLGKRIAIPCPLKEEFAQSFAILEFVIIQDRPCLRWLRVVAWVFMH
jgi:hypothetical protein